MNEFLECHRVGEASQNSQLLVTRELKAILCSFHPLLEPLADSGIIDVHVLDANGAAISVPKKIENFGKSERLFA